MFSAATVCLFVCLCVCQHDNFRMSEHGMMKLGGRFIVQKSPLEFEFGGHSPLGAYPKKVALGYDIGKIGAGCLVCY